MNDYIKALGDNLRRVREQQGMSLRDVEARSGGRWKAAALGCYERAERAFSTRKLADLAEFYGVPVADLLPKTDEPGPTKIVIDLERLPRLAAAEASKLARYVADIQSRRFDYNGRMLSIREADLRQLAKIYDTTTDELTRRLDDWGVLLTPVEKPAGELR